MALGFLAAQADKLGVNLKRSLAALRLRRAVRRPNSFVTRLADLRQPDGAVILVEPSEFYVFARQREGVVLELLAGLEVFVLAGPETRKRILDMLQGVHGDEPSHSAGRRLRGVG
jgi:hypothetical protein